ncbi:hypothetical protein HKX48_002737 [Thoreauomyces humboldtii]|nr:hypothetical protein HKX48_002737 [Thoreauomyces humboldtii]
MPPPARKRGLRRRASISSSSSSSQSSDSESIHLPSARKPSLASALILEDLSSDSDDLVAEEQEDEEDEEVDVEDLGVVPIATIKRVDVEEEEDEEQDLSVGDEADLPVDDEDEEDNDTTIDMISEDEDDDELPEPSPPPPPPPPKKGPPKKIKLKLPSEGGRKPASPALPSALGKKAAPAATVTSARKRKAAEIEVEEEAGAERGGGKDDAGDSDSSLGSEGPVASTKMTIRQRAMVARGAGDEVEGDSLLFSTADLPDERVTKRKIYTDEELALRKFESTRRRRHQALAKAEGAKHATIQKLLSRNDKKKNKDEDATLPTSPLIPTAFRTVQRVTGTTLSFPPDFLADCGQDVLDFGKIHSIAPPAPRTCAIPGCGAPKKYRHIPSGKDACSFGHFKALGGTAVA